MEEKIITFSKLPDNLNPNDDIIFKNEDEYDCFQIINKNLFVKNFAFSDINDCYFKKCVFGNIKCINIKICNNKIEESDLSNINFETSYIDSSDFLKNRMTGFNFTNSSLRNVSVRNCKLNLSSFRFSKLKNVIFENCILEEADFYGADLNCVIFRKCNLSMAEFSKSKMEQVDLRTSDISGIRIGLDSLAGAIINYNQVNDLAWLLGATIK